MTNAKINTKNIVLTGLLIALAVVIPMFMPRVINVPGFFTVTLASHVPVLLSMFINPICAAAVAVGSTIGFLFTSPPEVVVRAATHAIFAVVGALMLKKNINIFVVLVVTMLLHTVCETTVMFCFGIKLTNLQQTLPQATQAVALGIIAGLTCLHHLMDFVITFVIYKAIKPIGAFESEMHITKTHSL